MKWGKTLLLAGALSIIPGRKSGGEAFFDHPLPPAAIQTASVTDFLREPASAGTAFKIAVYSKQPGFQTTNPEIPKRNSLGIPHAETYFFSDETLATELEGGLRLKGIEPRYFAFDPEGRPLIRKEIDVTSTFYLGRHWDNLEILRSDLVMHNYMPLTSRRQTLEGCLIGLQQRAFRSADQLVQTYNPAQRPLGCGPYADPLTRDDLWCMMQQASGCRWMGRSEDGYKSAVLPNSGSFTLLDLMIGQMGVVQTAHAPFKVGPDREVGINNF